MNKRIIEIDWDDISELKKLSHKINNRRKVLLNNLGFSGINFATSKVNLIDVLPAFNSMLDTDCNHLFTGSSLNKYYVYFHTDPTESLKIQQDIKHFFLASRFPELKYVPFYVGKGVNNRYLDLNRNDFHRKIRTKLIRVNLDIIPVIIAKNLTEPDALALEAKLVDILGLKCFSDNSMLVNLDECSNKEDRWNCYPNDPIVNKILKSNGWNND